MVTCANEDGAAQPGLSLCAACHDRIWQELHWLADMYDELFKALTHRLNVEKAEQAKVKGAKDPMVQGLDLNDDATNLRHEIRGISYAGLSWLYQRNPEFAGNLKDPSQSTPSVLRFIARNLHWILSDIDHRRIKHWGSRVLAARLAAEILVTPAIPSDHRFRVEGVWCQHLWELESGAVTCAGKMYTYTMDTSVLVCERNAAHTVSRETMFRAALATRLKEGPTRALITKILGE